MCQFLTILVSVFFYINTLGQSNLKIAYDVTREIETIEQLKDLKFGKQIMTSFVFFSNGKYINYNKPNNKQDFILKHKSTDGKAIFPPLCFDSIQNVFYIDTFLDKVLYRGESFYQGITTMDDGSIYQTLPRVYKYKIFRYKFSNRNFVDYKLTNETKKIKGILCTKGKIFGANSNVYYEFWVALEIPCFFSINGITNMPGLLVEIYDKLKKTTYKLKSFEKNVLINDSVFKLKELDLPEINKDNETF